MKEIRIDKTIAGGRLDKLLFKYFNGAPSSFIYKMLRKKNIVLNENKAEGKTVLSEGDIIRIYLKDETIDKFRNTSDKKLNNNPLPELIIYEDENLIALNKPSGLLSQGSKNDEISLNDYLVDYLGITDFYIPGVSNRLDRNTSGIVLAGKNLPAARCLNEAIRNKKISKHYYVLVRGMAPNEEVYEDFLSKDNRENTVKISNNPAELKIRAYPISTSFTKISSNSYYSLLDVNLLTGRPHQIRAHLAYRGYPVIGDNKYGSPDINDAFRLKYGLNHQFLHAYKVSFDKTDGVLEYLKGKEVTAKMPEKFIGILKEEGIWPPGRAED